MSGEIEHLETLRFLVKTHRDEFERRRSYEWRCVLAGLTFFTLVIAFSGRPEAEALRGAIPVWLVWFLFLDMWGTGSVLLLYSHVAHSVNKEIAHRAEAAIQASLNGTEYLPLSLYGDLPSRPTIKGIIEVGSGGFWGWLWESIIALLFALGAAISVA